MFLKKHSALCGDVLLRVCCIQCSQMVLDSLLTVLPMSWHFWMQPQPAMHVEPTHVCIALI
ncbi:MAG: hypothetical protein ACKPKO_25865, partial [Candidatus Fonsibacter sp.]